MSQMENGERLMRRWFEEVWNKRNEAAIDEMFKAGGAAHGVPTPDSVAHGPEEFKVHYRSLCGAFPDIRIDIKDVIAVGNRVAVRWRATGTHLGDNLGITATGRPIVLDGATFCIVEGSQITEGWNLMDMGYLMQSLRSVAAASSDVELEVIAQRG